MSLQNPTDVSKEVRAGIEKEITAKVMKKLKIGDLDEHVSLDEVSKSKDDGAVSSRQLSEAEFAKLPPDDKNRYLEGP